MIKVLCKAVTGLEESFLFFSNIVKNFFCPSAVFKKVKYLGEGGVSPMISLRTG